MSARCAFDGCQAGGVILPGAPRVQPLDTTAGAFHPGCWAAETATGPELALMRVDPADRRPCRCIDKHDRQCVNLAGADGWCANCRDGSGPEGHAT